MIPGDGANPPGRFRDSYSVWRSSSLGRITDTLEEALVFDALGPPSGRIVLDVGCGDAKLSRELARRGAAVTGLDADPGMIAAAGEIAAACGVPLRLVAGEAERLPFADAVFDDVVAVTVLCFVRDAGRALLEMNRVLKPGGRIVIGELGKWSSWAAYRRIRGWLGNATWRRAQFRTPAELRRLAHGAGLIDAACRGAIYYPPFEFAARVLAPADRWLGARTTSGSAFIVLSATKPRGPMSRGEKGIAP